MGHHHTATDAAADAAANAADRVAAGRIGATRPTWTKLATARDALQLSDGSLLHAGPPFAAPDRITVPILNAGAHAAVFEGWVRDFDEGRRAIRAGEIRMSPAQDWRACAPLAATLSPSMHLQVVEDAAHPGPLAYAPLNTGLTPPMPLAGTEDPRTPERQREIETRIAPLIAAMLSEPIDLLELLDLSLAGGDECHGRSGVATARLRAVADARLEGSARTELQAFFEEAPAFFLFLAMATAKCMALAADGVAGASIVTAAGGNGSAFGIQVAGLPGRWFSAPGDPPNGFLFQESSGSLTRLGGIGDSAIIDAVGLGGMALSYAPELRELFRDALPTDATDRPAQLLETDHPRLQGGAFRTGLSARRVAASGLSPLAVLGILDAGGRGGIIGRGLFSAPVAAFATAVENLSQA